VRPNLVNFTNVLIAGCAPVLRERLSAALVVTLQGDDIFLDDLPEPHRSRAIGEIRKLVPLIDGFIVHSQYYADYMSDYLGIPRDKFRLSHLGIDPGDWREPPATDANRPPTIGYLARLAKEKGLHVLVDAFLELRRRHGTENAVLRIAGWLGEHNRAYAQEQFARLESAGLGEAYEYVGEVDRAGKIAFLRSIDVLSVPTTYREPKGLFVLEALAAGVPVVQPEHGAFPELIAATGGGRLFRPGDATMLADELHRLLTDHESRRQLGEQGREQVLSKFSSEDSARRVRDIYLDVVKSATSFTASPTESAP
jgi:glycosyltransferase involved in cell wall biosynthesis